MANRGLRAAGLTHMQRAAARHPNRPATGAAAETLAEAKGTRGAGQHYSVSPAKGVHNACRCTHILERCTRIYQVLPTRLDGVRAVCPGCQPLGAPLIPFSVKGTPGTTRARDSAREL